VSHSIADTLASCEALRPADLIYVPFSISYKAYDEDIIDGDPMITEVTFNGNGALTYTPQHTLLGKTSSPFIVIIPASLVGPVSATGSIFRWSEFHGSSGGAIPLTLTVTILGEAPLPIGSKRPNVVLHSAAGYVLSDTVLVDPTIDPIQFVFEGLLPDGGGHRSVVNIKLGDPVPVINSIPR
jgi:hypothetical protein